MREAYDISTVDISAIFFVKVLDKSILDQINALCQNFHREIQKTHVGRLSAYKPLECVYATKCLCLVMSRPFHRSVSHLVIP